jgi:hypothetical protein
MKTNSAKDGNISEYLEYILHILLSKKMMRFRGCTLFMI